jgi:hypothetical protein
VITRTQHAVSIAAIFVALAVGVVLGSQTLASGVLSGLRADRTDLQHQIDTLQGENNQLRAEAVAADGFDAATAGRVLHGALAQRTVVLVTTPDADPGDVEGAAKALGAAGASVVGRVALTAAVLDPASADRLRTTLTNMIPAGVQLETGAVDPGSLAGDFLGAVLEVNPQNQQPRCTPQELTLALDTLRGGGFLGSPAGTVRPGQLAVVVTGDNAAGGPGGAVAISDGGAAAGTVVAEFAAALRSRGGGAVLAGRPGAARGSGAVAVVRADPALAAQVSTVDDVDRPAGRVTAALALAEQAAGATGRYGTGPKATAVTVTAATGN